MKASFISLFCLLILPLASADPAPLIPPPQMQPGQPIPPPAAPLVRQPRPRGGGSQGGNDSAFNHNRSISLTGNVGENRDINLSITGIGPSFNSDCIIGDGTILSVQYNTGETEDAAIQVNYSIGLQVEVKMGNRSDYRNLTFNGRVLCKEGTPVQIYKNGSQTLSLGVDLTKKDEEKK